MSKLIDPSLKNSELRYRRLFEASQDGILILDARTGMIEDVNPYLIKLLGYSREELIKKKLWEVGAFRDIEASKDDFEALQENEYIRYEDLPLKTKDGRLIQVEFISNVYPMGNEKVIQCNIRNITARKRAEEALSRSEERYRLLVETLPDGVIVHSQGRVVFANLASATIIGAANPADLTGKPVIEFVHPAYRELALKRIQQSLSEGIPVPIAEEKFVRLDGTLIDVEVSAMPISYAGKPAMVTVFTEITERKRAEEALKKSEGKFRAIFDNASDGMFVVDLKMRKFFICNTTCAKMLGYAQDEFLNLNIADIHPEEDLHFIFEQIGKYSRGEEGIRSDIRFKRKNGSFFEADLSPALLTIGEKEYLLINFTDITERKQAEERIQRQLEHLTALSAIDRFIAANFDLKLSLSEILTHVTKELGIDAAVILLINSNSQMLEYGAGCGFRNNAVRKVQVRLGEGYAGRAALERQLVQIPNLSDGPANLYLSTILKDEDFVCCYAVPLIAKGQVKGVLEVFHRTAREPDAEWFDFLNALAGQTAIAIENATLFESLRRSNLELTLAYDATIEGWSYALDLRDKETEGHTQRVTEMTVRLAQECGINTEAQVHVRRGALLHDIGKLGVPDYILLKPGPLSADEWVIMKKHPVYAYEMLNAIDYLKPAIDIPYDHHEHWDGSGYPRGLKGKEIPLVARIFTIVDVWDGLTSDRPYRPAWSKEAALAYIHEQVEKLFDPLVVEKFLRLIGQP